MKMSKLKTSFYEEFEHLVYQLLNDYMKIILWNFNAIIGKENIFKSTVGLESLHEKSNDNGVRVTNLIKILSSKAQSLHTKISTKKLKFFRMGNA